MKKATTVLCFLCVLTIFNIHSAYSHQSPAQSGAQLPNPLLVLYNAAKTGDSGKYFAAGIELQAREKEYLESPEAAGYIQNIAMYHSIIGEYHQALSGFDHLRPPNTSQPSSNQQSSPLDGYTPQNAFQVIESTADIRQVIFINEAHHVPRHRAFTLQLLKVLYQKGFRYFAAETLSDADAELGRRGYPLFGKTGIYTNEPVYGDLVRTALKLGYTVVPYEENSPCSPDEKDPDSCIKKRERGQAQHLYDRILAKDSKAKILVHAGYSHINKGGFGRGLLSMAQNFKEISGIEPFSIDQVQMILHGYKTGPAVPVSNMQSLLELPGPHGRSADVAGFTCPHHIMQGFHRLFDGSFIIPAMDLIQVHIIGAQALQTVIDLAQNGLAG